MKGHLDPTGPIDPKQERGQHTIGLTQGQEGSKRKEIRAPCSALEESLIFLKTFLRSPATVGSVVPSSRYLARAVAEQHNLASARVVVELGPGTGAVTKYVLPHLSPDALYIAIELDPLAVEVLRKRWPHLVVYHDSAERMKELLARHGVQYADAVISGLPWGSMPEEVQDRIMHVVRESMRPGSTFTTYSYFFTPLLPKGKRYYRLLKQLFPEVRIVKFLLPNFPPAVIFRAVA